MSRRTEQGITQGIRASEGIYFRNPLRKREDDSVIVNIVVSKEKIRAIRTGMLSGHMIWYPGEPAGDANSRALIASIAEAEMDFINALMPDRINSVLKEVLTPKQYQRALEANRNGKLVKFSIKGRPC